MTVPTRQVAPQINVEEFYCHIHLNDGQLGSLHLIARLMT